MGVPNKQSNRSKQYSSEFKREAVRLVTEGGLSIAQVARDLGLNDNMVSRWKKEAEQNGQKAFPGQGHPQDEELSRLRRENEVLRQERKEREILKKAISIFSEHRVGKQSGNEGDALSIHSRASRPVPHDDSAACAGRVSQRILRMAKASAESTRPAGTEVNHADQRTVSCEPRALWQSSHPSGLAGSGNPVQPEAGLVARIMKEQNLVVRKARRFVVTTDSNHAFPLAQNLLNREYQVESVIGLNRAWAGDITYIPTAQGWLYVAVILDLKSRKVIGWSMRDSLEQTLVHEALEMALDQRFTAEVAEPLLFHSDRGSQDALMIIKSA